jgi:two-component system, cell cycle sensor histidine kinase and response regulator CckA
MSTTGAAKHVNASQETEADRRAMLLTYKSELIGELAQAMANEFNNIMMAVTGYAELELKKASTKEKRSLEQVLNCATRATSLIQKLLDFSRSRVPSPQPLELDACLSDLSELIKELLREHADLTLQLGSRSEIIRADRVQLEQTLVALVLIARNAMAGKGMVTISTSVIDLDRPFIGTETAEPGKYLVWSVESHGTSDQCASNSTDGNQNNSGNLSLATVREIVKGCQGLAGFSIQPDACGLKLYFPVATAAAQTEQGLALPRQPAIARTILIVEDDDAVRIPAAEFLMMEGFKVLQARTGSEALNLVQQSRSPLDILVTDILMPKMNGHEVAAALLEQHPKLKVLYISGDPTRSALAGSGGMSTNETLRKPFRLNVLRDKMHDLLGE